MRLSDIEIVKADFHSNFHYVDPKSSKNWMLCWNAKKRSLVLEEFDREKAIALLDKEQAVILI